MLYAGQNQFDKARAALEMAIRTNPSYATAHENLGDIYAKLASQAYNKALQLDGSNANAVRPKLALIRDLFTAETRSTARPTAAAPAPAGGGSGQACRPSGGSAARTCARLGTGTCPCTCGGSSPCAHRRSSPGTRSGQQPPCRM